MKTIPKISVVPRMGEAFLSEKNMTDKQGFLYMACTLISWILIGQMGRVQVNRSTIFEFDLFHSAGSFLIYLTSLCIFRPNMAI